MRHDLAGVRRLIRLEAAKVGSLRRLSVAWKIPYAYIGAALHTNRSPSPQILTKLGLRRVTVVRYITADEPVPPRHG